MQRIIPQIIDGVAHWRCTKCQALLPGSEYHQRPDRWNGIYSQCRKCRNKAIKARKDEHREEYRAKERAAAKRRYAANPAFFKKLRRFYFLISPHKEKARHAVNDAVRAGRMYRPGMCSSCGKECIPEGHHIDYSKPLDVIWLCSVCHRAADMALRNPRSPIPHDMQGITHD